MMNKSNGRMGGMVGRRHVALGGDRRVGGAMKTRLLIQSVAITVFVSATANVWAMPPRQHSVSGIITDINHDAHTLTVAPPKGDPFVFVWKDSTRFSQEWRRICLGTLESGQSVKVYYRREIGQLVPREVTLRTETITRCTAGKCC